MNRHSVPSLACAVALVLGLSGPVAMAQGRGQASPGPLVDLDGSIEALVQAVDPSVVQIFTVGLAPGEGLVAGRADLVTTQRASGSLMFVASTVE